MKKSIIRISLTLMLLTGTLSFSMFSSFNPNVTKATSAGVEVGSICVHVTSSFCVWMAEDSPEDDFQMRGKFMQME